MLPYHTVSPVREQLRKLFDHRVIASQLDSSVLLLAEQFKNHCGILPEPNYTITTTWALVPNVAELPSPFPLNEYSYAPPSTARTTPLDGIDPALEPHLRSASSDRHDFTVFFDPQFDTMPMSDVSKDSAVLSAGGRKVLGLLYSRSESSSTLGTSESGSELSYSPTLPVNPPPSPVPSLEENTSSSTSDDGDLFHSKFGRNADSKDLIRNGMKIIVAQGFDEFVPMILECGIRDEKMFTKVAVTAKGIQQALSIKAPKAAKCLAYNLRLTAMGMFREHWNTGIRRIESKRSTTYFMTRKVNIAGLMGSLFTVGLVTAGDIHRCLELLVDNTDDYYHLCAMHTLVMHANDKLYKAKSRPAIARFRRQLSYNHPDHSNYTLGSTVTSQSLVAEIMNRLDRWKTEQDIRQGKAIPRL